MAEVNARILLWGIEGCGKTTTLQTIHAKLRPELRGELRSEPTRLDPTVQFEALPISLGEIGGVGTRIEILAVPGSAEQEMTRKQLLDEVDGIILVVDCSPERIEANFSAIDELRNSLAAYGRRLDDFPIVLQYNKRDIADPFAIEDLHRRIGLDQAAVFETIATSGHGILATLTTISKHVVRARRGATTGSGASTTVPEIETPSVAADTTDAAHEVLESAILSEGSEIEEGVVEAIEIAAPAETAPDWQAVSGDGAAPKAELGATLRIVSAGQASVDAEGGVRLPLVLGDDEGRTRSVVLSLRLDPLLDGGGD